MLRKPRPILKLLATTIMLITAMIPMASAAQDASPPPDGLPGRGAENLPTYDANLRFTFLGCDDGVDPQQTPDQCTTPVPAPETAYVATYPDVVSYVHAMDVDDDGAYVSSAISGETLDLNGFFPTDYNNFMFEGVDDNERWASTVTLESGETRDITIYYWNGPDGLIQPGENTVSVTVLGCPDGVDPNEDAASCTEPIDAPGTVRVSYGELHGPLNQAPRDENGAYTFSDLPPYTHFTLSTHNPAGTLVTGDAESITDEGAEVYALRGETRQLTVYIYNQGDGSGGEGTGAIRIVVRGCPEGVDPNVDADACDIPLDIPDSARVVHRGDLLNVVVAEQPRADDGAYIIEDVIPEGYPIVGLDHDEYDTFVLEGLTESGLVGNVIEVRPGETTEIRIYYAHAG